MNAQLDQMIQEAYPDFYADLEAKRLSLEEAKSYVDDHCLTESESEMLTLMTVQNKITRIEAALKTADKEYEALERDAAGYSSSYRETVKAALGVKDLRKIIKVLETKSFIFSHNSSYLQGLKTELKKRDMYLNAWPKMQELYPAFVGTLPDIKET